MFQIKFKYLVTFFVCAISINIFTNDELIKRNALKDYALHDYSSDLSKLNNIAIGFEALQRNAAWIESFQKENTYLAKLNRRHPYLVKSTLFGMPFVLLLVKKLL